MPRYQWKDGRERSPLPIDGYLEEILELLEKYQVVIVHGALGCGKTLRLGQALALAEQHRFYDSPDVPPRQTYLTQTRRNALRWNGARICEELGCKPGELAGWHLRGFPTQLSEQTLLHLLMDRSLCNYISENGGALPPGDIIVDEVHENTLDLVLLLGLLKTGLPKSPSTRVILASGTMDTGLFSSFFGNVPIVTVPGQEYVVTTNVVPLDVNEHHTEGAIRVAEGCIDRFLSGALLVGDQNNPRRIEKGSIILLLPGKDDLRRSRESILQYADEAGSATRIECFSVHGESEPSVQDRILEPVPPGVLRFVVGTEILRTSVTVRDRGRRSSSVCQGVKDKFLQTFIFSADSNVCTGI